MQPSQLGTLRGKLRLYFANYTAFTVAARTYLLQLIDDGYDMCLGVELHLRGVQLNQARKLFRKAGMTSRVCQARPGKTPESCSGGEWILTRANILTSSHYKPAEHTNWASTIIRVRGVDVVVISLYLIHGRNPNSLENKAILESLGNLLKMSKLPFIIAADWNATPAELQETFFLTYIGGSIKVPTNVSYTCSSGKGAILDYIICSNCLADAIDVLADLNGPWKPHYGLHIAFRKEALTEEVRMLRTPLPLPVCQGPRRETWQGFADKALQCPLEKFGKAAETQGLGAKIVPVLGGRENPLTSRGLQVRENPLTSRGLQVRWPQEAGLKCSKKAGLLGQDKQDARASCLSIKPERLNLPKSSHFLTDATSKEAFSKLDVTFTCFSMAAELHLLDASGLSLDQYEPFMGRGANPCTSMHKLIPPNKVGSFYKDPHLTYFSTLHARIVELLRLRHSRSWGRHNNHKQFLVIAEWVSLQGSHVASLVGFPVALLPFLVSLPLRLRLVLIMSLTELKSLKQELTEVVTALHKLSMQSSRASYKHWLEMHIKSGGGKAIHAVLKQPFQPTVEVAQAQQEAWGPTRLQAMQARARFWTGQWHRGPAISSSEWEALDEQLLAQAKVEQADQPSITLGQVLSALAASPAKTGVGTDQWLAKTWVSLPLEGKQELHRILRQCENALDWPSAVKHTLIALIPKPAGGDRPIGLTNALYRVWSIIRKWQTSQWEAAHHGFWDTAIRGSTPLRAAILREMSSEICTYFGIEVSQVLWDMEKFFDSISQMSLIQGALNLQYPATNLYMGLLVHRSDRYLTCEGCLSEPIQISRTSILAGCMQSVAWTRCLLHDILDHMHAAYRPITIHSWVDDLAQRIQGTSHGVLEKTVDVCLELVSLLKKKGCKISPKSVIMASKPRLARDIQSRLASHGIKLKIASASRDLGIDASLGTGRRATGTFKGRFYKAFKKTGILKGLVKITKKARGLYHTAVKPMALWGHQAKGIPPGQLYSYRANMARTLGISRPGGCTTTGISLVLGPNRDPLLQVPLETCSLWFEVWQHVSNQHLLIDKLWPNMMAKLVNPATRWKNVLGPIAALAATLLDIGWQPKGALNWVDFEGTEWFLDPSDPLLVTQFQQHLARQVELHVWKKASTHLYGKGLEQGVDWTVPFRKLKGYSSHQLHLQHGCCMIVMQGAVWDAARERESKGQAPPLCPQCGQTDSWLHVVWECPHTKQCEDPRIQMTNSLCVRALEGHVALPCLWLRGLTPWEWTWGKTLGHEVPQRFHSEGPWLEAPHRLQLPPGAIAGTDGSGGEHSKDPRLRRVAWGLTVATHEDFSPLASASGPVLGRQTVPRAELTALVWLIRHTQGPVDVAIDAKYVVKGFVKGPAGTHKSNQDLWADLWAASADREGSISVHWTPSHVGAKEIDDGIVEPWAFTVNVVADALAETAAEQHQLPWHLVQEVGMSDGLAHKILSRLTCVLQRIIESKEQSDQPLRVAVDKVQPPSKAAVVLEIAALSSHHVIDKPGAYSCSLCGLTIPKRKSQTEICSWLQTECKGTRSDLRPIAKTVLEEVSVMHQSHSPSTYRGIQFCVSCGGWKVSQVSKTSKKLSLPCDRKATAAGQAVLRALSKGRLPGSLKQWPV